MLFWGNEMQIDIDIIAFQRFKKIQNLVTANQKEAKLGVFCVAGGRCGALNG